MEPKTDIVFTYNVKRTVIIEQEVSIPISELFFELEECGVPIDADLVFNNVYKEIIYDSYWNNASMSAPVVDILKEDIQASTPDINVAGALIAYKASQGFQEPLFDTENLS